MNDPMHALADRLPAHLPAHLPSLHEVREQIRSVPTPSAADLQRNVLELPRTVRRAARAERRRRERRRMRGPILIAVAIGFAVGWAARSARNARADDHHPDPERGAVTGLD
ncbi:MAG TPA: hypothetical protein VGQ20_06860 [Acidimicrobiales bacterium]|jgi:hypothetical protein|nr:hypothetical protein [Acidimicrobiales bacterium]